MLLCGRRSVAARCLFQVSHKGDGQSMSDMSLSARTNSMINGLGVVLPYGKLQYRADLGVDWGFRMDGKLAGRRWDHAGRKRDKRDMS
jgi:hypothetical protein